MELTMEQCCERLENMDDIAVLCHRNPDGDTLGCAFALKYMLEQLGKRVQVKSHDGFRSSILICIRKASRNLSRNLLLRWMLPMKSFLEAAWINIREK